MAIISIDTTKKEIQIPKSIQTYLRKAKDVGDERTLWEVFKLDSYEIVNTLTVKKEKTDQLKREDIKKFMESKGKNDTEKYKDYKELISKDYGKTKDGKAKEVNFFILKKWFYNNYKDQKPSKAR